MHNTNLEVRKVSFISYSTFFYLKVSKSHKIRGVELHTYSFKILILSLESFSEHFAFMCNVNINVLLSRNLQKINKQSLYLGCPFYECYNPGIFIVSAMKWIFLHVSYFKVCNKS